VEADPVLGALIRQFGDIRAWLICAACGSVGAQFACAQDGTDEVLDEIVVTGTRRVGRAITESSVPIDVFRGEKLRSMGTSDMDDILRTLIPSYVVRRFPINDEASLVRPATLRRMPPDYTLVLLNGKRRHRSGVIVGPTQGPDVAAIPAIAVERLELLRDGASAQYGSDAIAGVLNFITRSDNEGLIAEVETGQFYAGDGRANRFSGNAGFSLADDGFLNLALEYGSQDFTSRSIQRPDAAALESVGAPGIPNPAQLWGQPKIDNELKLFASSTVRLPGDTELYGFGNYSERDVELEFFWRNPNEQGGIFSSGPERLVFDLTSDGSGNCPLAGTPAALPVQRFPTQPEYDLDVLALAALAADANCWVVNERYPAGYKPFFGATMADASAVVGLRGEFSGGLLWDVSLAYGRNGADYGIRETINASLGPASPTTFDPGETIQADTNINLDFVLPVNFEAFYSPLNVAAGFERREESFEIVAGDQGSWTAGPLASQGASIGSHGFPGYSLDQAGKWERSNIALYLDLEADVTERLTLGLAGRYEDFEDFGSTGNYKASFRYRFSDVFGIRGAASTGFRAPTPGLSHQTKLSTVLIQGELYQGGRIAPTNPVAEFYGGKALEAEDAENLSIGLTLNPLNNLTITADYFRINIENGISLTGGIEITDEDRQALIDQGVPGATDFAFIEFYGNDTTAKIWGWDLVANYVKDWQERGTTEISLAFNDTQTKLQLAGLTANRQGLIAEQFDLRYRGILTVSHSWNDLRILVRASYYDGWAEADLPFGPPYPVCSEERPVPFGADGCYSDAWLIDIEATYALGNRITVIAGADNVFDEYPDTHFLYPDFSSGQVYPDSSPFGFNGGFWYLRLRAEF